MRDAKKWLNSFARGILNAPLYMYLGIGIYFLVGIIKEAKTFEELVSTYSAPLGMFLASQIAGFAVVRNISNTNQIEENKKISDAEKSKKVLNAYFRHLQLLGINQVNMLNEFIKYVNTLVASNERLTNAHISEMLYDDSMNLIVFMNPIESMLSPDLHKYVDVEVMDYILNLKVQVVTMMQSMKLAKNIMIPANKHQELLLLLTQMKNETQDILDSSKDIIKRL